MGRIENCEKNFGALFGGKPADQNTGNDPEMMMILQRWIFGEVFETGHLDPKMRELITVVCLTAMQTLPQLKAHTNAALNIGNSPLQIREAVYQCAPFIGFPRTLNALDAINEVFAARGIQLPLETKGTVTEEDRYERGLAIQNPVYGNEIRDKYAGLPDGIGEALPRFLTEVCFGDFYARGVLTLQQRELLILCVLTSLGAQQQIKAHIKGNLKAGNRRETLYAAILQCLPYIGFPAAFNTMNCVMETENQDL